MEYSVSLYSFYSAIQKGELTPLGCVEKAAELGTKWARYAPSFWTRPSFSS